MIARSTAVVSSDEMDGSEGEREGGTEGQEPARADCTRGAPRGPCPGAQRPRALRGARGTGTAGAGAGVVAGGAGRAATTPTARSRPGLRLRLLHLWIGVDSVGHGGDRRNCVTGWGGGIFLREE